MKKILIMSDSPRIYTGFSHMGRELAMFLHNTGRWDVSYLGWFDEPANKEQLQFPFRLYRTMYDTNGRPVRDDGYAYRSFRPVVERENPDIVLAIGDPWMSYAPVSFGYEDKNERPFYAVCYPPIDGNPIPTSTTHMGINGMPLEINWVDLFARYDKTIAYCDYGINEINRAAGRKICDDFIYYGVDTDIYKPLPIEERIKIKKEIFGLNEDDFLLVTVARNQPRKLYPVMLEAVKMFIEKHEKTRKVYYYIHAPLNDPMGWNLTDLATKYGLPYRTIGQGESHRRVIFDPKLGVGRGPTDEVLNKYFNAADAGYFIFSSEGWGMPPHECMGTRTATIMTNYSAPTDWAKDRTCFVNPVNVFPESRSNFMRAQVEPVDVVEAIKKVYNDKEYRQKIAKAGYEFAQSTDWKKCILPEWERKLYDIPLKEKATKREVIYLRDADSIVVHTEITQPKVSIIIPTFNGGKLLSSCINSIRECEYKNYEIIIGDNGTWIPDQKRYIQFLVEGGNVKVVNWPTKYSPSKVLNKCAEVATGKYLLFLDNDTVVSPNSIALMVECFDKDKCGAASVKLQHPKTGQSMNGLSYDGKLGFVPSSDMPPVEKGKKPDPIIERDALSGSCMMVEKEVFDKVGKFDENYLMYYQDFDLCCRLYDEGYKCYSNTNATIFHVGGGTIRHISKSIHLQDHMLLMKKFWPTYIPKSVNEEKKETIGILKLLTMGDCILITPIIPYIRERHPNAKLILYTSKEYHDLFVNNPFIDEMKIVGPLVKTDFGPNWAMMAYDSIAFNVITTDSLDKLYSFNQLDMFLEYRRTGTTMTKGYARMFDIELKSEKYQVYTDEKNEDVANGIISSYPGDGPVIVMHTTAGWMYKEWDINKFKILAESLYNKYKARIFVVGAPHERLETTYVRNICGILSLRDMVALMRKADLYIGGDSGPMHLAKAADCPMVVMFGCTCPAVVGFDEVSNYIALQSPYAGEVNCGFGECPMETMAKREGKLYDYCTKRLEYNTVFDSCCRMLERKEDIRENRKGSNLCTLEFKNWEWHTTLLEGENPSDMCTYGKEL